MSDLCVCGSPETAALSWSVANIGETILGLSLSPYFVFLLFLFFCQWGTFYFRVLFCIIEQLNVCTVTSVTFCCYLPWKVFSSLAFCFSSFFLCLFTSFFSSCFSYFKPSLPSMILMHLLLVRTFTVVLEYVYTCMWLGNHKRWWGQDLFEWHRMLIQKRVRRNIGNSTSYLWRIGLTLMMNSSFQGESSLPHIIAMIEREINPSSSRLLKRAPSPTEKKQDGHCRKWCYLLHHYYSLVYPEKGQTPWSQLLCWTVYCVDCWVECKQVRLM